jgi:hypothetical protein
MQAEHEDFLRTTRQRPQMQEFAAGLIADASWDRQPKTLWKSISFW